MVNIYVYISVDGSSILENIILNINIFVETNFDLVNKIITSVLKVAHLTF
jgi:hypothetical protein